MSATTVTTYVQLRAAIKRRRIQLGLTPDDVAHAAGLPKGWVARFEAGGGAYLSQASMSRLFAALAIRLFVKTSEKAA